MARNVTISSIAWSAEQDQPVTEACAKVTELLRLAAKAKPDLVIFPELFLHCGQRASMWTQPDPLPNAITDHFGMLAKELGTNLAIPLPITENGRIYNSAVVINRRGEIVGHYDKTHLTPGEQKAGVSPGGGPKVHALDFGRIGHAICYDLNFSHLAEEMQTMDVEVLCIHSMFAGGQLLNHWALTAGAYLLSAYQEESVLIDMTGAELMRIGNRYEQFNIWKLPPVLTVRVNLDRRLFHVDYNVADYDGAHGGVHRLLAECADKATIDHNLPASVLAIGALEGVTIQELIDRYNLWTRNDFFRQSRLQANEQK